MRRQRHEVRDPIHTFVYFDDRERDVVNSRAFQRLRHIHQLGMSHFLYPGANHTRFEHCLGVMELATRVFDRITRDDLLTDELKDLIPEFAEDEKLGYWRQVLRMAALCHDLGHLPFSHAAEEDLLPDACTHEDLTIRLIDNGELSGIWGGSPPLKAEDIAEVAVGPDRYGDGQPDTVVAILSEIITGDAFGVDRMDYLVRDSYHAGVAYGSFDHYRLTDTLRILPAPPYGDDRSQEPTLGVEQGGIHSAEALLLARYFMFKQVYFHHVRRIYDIHLRDFLNAWLPDGRFPNGLDGFLEYTDNEVMSALLEATYGEDTELRELAERITLRRHFRRIYQPSPDELDTVFDPRAEVYAALFHKFGEERVREDHVGPRREEDDERPRVPEFPVLADDEVLSATAVSEVLSDIPEATVDYVFIHPDDYEKGKRWLEANKQTILPGEGSDDNNEPA